MLRRFGGHMRQNLIAYVALFFALGGTSAYAATAINTIRSSDIVDGEVYPVDVRNDNLSGGGLSAADLAPNAVASSEVRDDTLVGGGLLAQDLAASSVRGSEVLDSSLGGADIQNGTLSGLDISFGSLDGTDILDNSLTGADINESTLVGVKDGDGCGNSGAALFVNARLCAGSDGVNRRPYAAHAFCASIGLRLPTWGEAVLLAVRYDVPGVAGTQKFWTDEIIEATTFSSVTGALNEAFMVVVDENGNGYGNNSFASNSTVCFTTPD